MFYWKYIEQYLNQFDLVDAMNTFFDQMKEKKKSFESGGMNEM